MSRVGLVRAYPASKQKYINEISLVLNRDELLDEDNEKMLTEIEIKKEHKKCFKRRNLIMFEKRVLLVMDGNNPKPENILFLAGCTISRYGTNSTTFLVQDHVHNCDYIIKWEQLKQNANNFLTENNYSMNNIIITSNSNVAPSPPPFTAHGETLVQIPQVIQILKEHSEDNRSTFNFNASSNEFVKIPEFSEVMQEIPILSFFLKFTGCYPWKGPLSYLSHTIRFIMLANTFSVAYSFYEQDPATFVWNLPVVLFLLLSVYNHYFTTRIFRSQHMRYLISNSLQRKSNLKRIQQWIVRATATAVILDSIFLVVVSLFVFNSSSVVISDAAYYVLGLIGEILMFLIHIPSTLLSLMTLSFVNRMHSFAVSSTSLLTKKMIVTNTLSPRKLYTHLLHHSILISKTSKWSVGVYINVFIAFAVIFVLGIFQLTRSNIGTDLYNVLITLMEVFIAFVIFFIAYLPISALNYVCDQTTNQILFLLNFNHLHKMGVELENSLTFHNVGTEQQQQEHKDSISYLKTLSTGEKLEFSAMLEKMQLGLVVGGVKVTFGRVFSVLYIFGTIAVFIIAQSSLFKSVG
eukprot:TRINITY_DN3655_c0_g1_i1.p1 TRINITY_DN3655_c0_g1~~TRINITY_DN3655_c0_g1_i1.p1  ORF type:complete len:577 (-),score=51.95 TRINITY_DN3655_c0_g1_i1:322-2052(-)